MLFFIGDGSIFDLKDNSRFNTSHVILYLLDKPLPFKGKMFQYISCYSLSSAALSACPKNTGFNTSHVILYHKKEIIEMLEKMFQYISCYSLSGMLLWNQEKDYSVSIHLMLFFIGKEYFFGQLWGGFQYISCYSLSILGFSIFSLCIRFNTSHVILYRA